MWGRATGAIGAAVAAVALLLAAFAPPAYSDHGVQDFDGLTVVFIGPDTGGGSTLIMLPNDKTWLVQSHPADVPGAGIMNAPHHGSKHAGAQDFTGATPPGVVAFSADRDGQYGHPHAEAVARYQSAGVQHAYATHDSGTTVQTGGTGCSIMTAGNGEIPCFDGIRTVSSTSPTTTTTGATTAAPPEPAVPITTAAGGGGPEAAADGTRTKQKSVEVTIADRAGPAYVKHVIRPTAQPVQIDLVQGAVEDLTFAAGGTGGRAAVPPSMTVGDNDAVVVGPSGTETVVQYVLRDAVVLRDGLWTLDFSYPGVTTAFILPEGLDLVFVNGNPVYMEGKRGFNCHGCYVTLEYPPGGQAVVWEAVWEEDRFGVEIRSVPEVRDPWFDQPAKAITFGTSQANQSVTTIIPQELLGGPYSVLLDGQTIQYHEYLNNGTHAWLNVRPAAPGEVAIVGTTVIPEFPVAVALVAGLLAAVLAIVPLAARGRGGEMAAAAAGLTPR